MENKDEIPRFVLSITDTHTKVGDQYFNISAGSNNLLDFTKRTPDEDGKKRTEIQRMFIFFAEQVDKINTTNQDNGGKQVDYKAVEITGGDNAEED